MIDQMLPFDPQTTENRFLPFAFTDVLSEYAGVHHQEFLHFWQLPDTMILGMKDTRVPYFTEGISALNDCWLSTNHPQLRRAWGHQRCRCSECIADFPKNVSCYYRCGLSANGRLDARSISRKRNCGL